MYQTTDAFINLARSAHRELIIMVPFLDDQGVSFLLNLFSLCAKGVKLSLICRPLSEPECGLAFKKRAGEFAKLNVAIYEYALPSALPSGRETFHAKVIVADDRAYYVGSSNFMASALGRSLECGVIVNGESARQLFNVVEHFVLLLRSFDEPAGFRREPESTRSTSGIHAIHESFRLPVCTKN